MSEPSLNISRRQFIRRTAGFGAALAAGGGLTGIPRALASGTRGPRAAAAGATITYATDATLGPLLTPFFKRFDKEYAPLKAGLSLLSGSYETLLAARFAGGATGIDMVFSDPGYAEFWYQSGWIQPLDGLPGLAALNADISPASLKKELVASDGKQIAIPYYSGLDLFCYNKAITNKHGIKPPTTWDEVTTASIALQKAGIQYPLALFWDKDFALIFSTFLAHCASDGMKSAFAKNLEPTFDTDPIALEVLTRWRKWYSLGLVAPDVLTGNYTAVQNLFSAGKAAFAEGTLQFIKPWQTTKNTAAYGNTEIILMPGKTHGSLVTLSLYHMTAQTKNRAATWELMKYLAWKDPKSANQYVVPTGYLVTAFGLTAPYAGLLKSTQVKNSFSFLNVSVLGQQSAKAVSLFSPADRATWFTGFQNRAAGLLQQAVLGSMSPQAALKSAADYARSHVRRPDDSRPVDRSGGACCRATAGGGGGSTLDGRSS